MSMPGGQFSHLWDKMSLAWVWDKVGQFRDDPGHSGTVGKPTTAPLEYQHSAFFTDRMSFLSSISKWVVSVQQKG